VCRDFVKLCLSEDVVGKKLEGSDFIITVDAREVWRDGVRGDN
jgi:hypothetical protein